jgi:membrane-bound lytic murein transglycosylase B
VIRAIFIASLLAGAATGVRGAQQLTPAAPLPHERPAFDVWLADVRTEAASRGIRNEVLDSAFEGLAPVDQILERDRTQAEFALRLDQYLQRRLTRPMVRTAQQMYTQQRELVQQIGKKYGVQPRVLIAIWGLESNFGKFAGVRPTIATLATLAYDQRRSTLFRRELFSALEILNRGDIAPQDLKGSWAGALGQPQFMPSTYLQYAQDFDGDGRRDIWGSRPDVFASVAHYLQQLGWNDGETWGREVKVPAAARKRVARIPLRVAGCRAERSLTEPRPLAEWRKMGVRTMANSALPTARLNASMVKAGSRTFLVYQNYEALLGYNCAHTYALSVALLADRLK